VLGVYLIQQPHVGTDDFAIFIALVSAAATSVAMIGLHKLRGVNPNAVVVHFSAVATVAASTSFFLFEKRTDAAPFYDSQAIPLLLGVGLTASVGQMFLTRAFAEGDPARVSVVGLSQVVFTLIIDVTISGHAVTTTILIGTLLILAPTTWVMMERRRRKHASPADHSQPVSEEAIAQVNPN